MLLYLHESKYLLYKKAILSQKLMQEQKGSNHS